MQVSNVSFGKIYQVLGDKKNMKQLRSVIAQEQKDSGNGAFVYNAQKILGANSMTMDSMNGKGFYFVVTGDDYQEEIRNREKSSLGYLFGCTDKIIHVGDNVKRDSFEIIKSIRENI